STFPPAPLPHTPPLSLHDALPISLPTSQPLTANWIVSAGSAGLSLTKTSAAMFISLSRNFYSVIKNRNAGHDHHSDPSFQIQIRSEEHTSELQSPDHIVCRLLLEK